MKSSCIASDISPDMAALDAMWHLLQAPTPYKQMACTAAQSRSQASRHRIATSARHVRLSPADVVRSAQAENSLERAFSEPPSSPRLRQSTFGATLDFIEALCDASAGLTAFAPVRLQGTRPLEIYWEVELGGWCKCVARHLCTCGIWPLFPTAC